MKHCILIISILVSFAGCKKGFLDKPYSNQLVIPGNLDEFQAILDFTSYLNKGYPNLGEVSTDDYYVLDSRWQSTTLVYLKNAYIWAADLYEGDRENTPYGWAYAYRIVFYANTVLDGLAKIQKTTLNEQSFNAVKGSGFFFRSLGFYLVAQQFAETYDPQTASSALGIPLRLNAGIDEPSVRSTVAQTYEQIINDATAAYDLLPVTTPAKTRPSKAAAAALLARAYLVMGDYSNALKYADLSLTDSHDLMDFNELNVNLGNPIARFNKETVFHALLQPTTFTTITGRRIDSVLYKSYEDNDLRKKIFFKVQADGVLFRGSYDGSAQIFCGLATDEMYLVRAECNARIGKTQEAMKDLNDLLKTRWLKNPDGSSSYQDQTALNAEDALHIVLTERRKELVCRGTRWTDLRRLNLEAAFAKTITRKILGQTYTLPPKSNRYVLPIPITVLELAQIPQNLRTQ